MSQHDREGDGGNGWTLHPFLPTNEEPAPRLWYVVPSPNDDEDNAYGPRVGHGCCYCGDSWLVFFGGATTDGLSADVAILHIASTNWIKASWQDEPCPCPRYDHGMVYSLEQHAIYVFGGVAQTGNLNDLWCLELATWTWHEIAQQGSIPTPRAVHHLIDIEGRLLLFGGGEQNQTAVDDTCIYIFEIATRTWTKHAGHGDIPSPRQGHAVCVVQPQNLNLTDIVETTSSTTREACVLVHGGLHHGAFMNDMYQLNTSTMTWTQIDQHGLVPSSRSGHAICQLGPNIILTGGLGLVNDAPVAHDDVFLFDFASKKWRPLELETMPAASRIDFSLVPINWRCLVLHPPDERTANPVAAEENDTGANSVSLHTSQTTQESYQPAGQFLVNQPVSEGDKSENVHDITPSFGIVGGGLNESNDVNMSIQPQDKELQKDIPKQSPMTVSKKQLPLLSKNVAQTHSDTALIYGGADLMGNIHNDCLILRI